MNKLDSYIEITNILLDQKNYLPDNVHIEGGLKEDQMNKSLKLLSDAKDVSEEDKEYLSNLINGSISAKDAHDNLCAEIEVALKLSRELKNVVVGLLYQ